MPTGYTACIEKGATFKQFAWGCARAFGAFIMQRDDNKDAPLVLEDKPDAYYTESFTKARAELVRIREMSTKQITVVAEAEAIAAESRNAGYVREKLALREAYTKMLEEIQAWEPPSPQHVRFREFMIQQVTDSMKGDCDMSYYDAPVERMPPEQWRAKRIAAIEDDIAWDLKHISEEEQRCLERTTWKKALVASLGMPEKVKET